MGIEDCVAKIVKDSNGVISPQKARNLFAKVIKQSNAGIPESVLVDEVQSLIKKKGALISLRRYNIVRDFTIRKEAVNRVIRNLEEPDNKTFANQLLSKLGYNNKISKLKRGLYDYVRNFEQWDQAIDSSAKQLTHSKLERAGVLDFVKNNANAPNIFREMAALSKAAPSLTSVTGDERAFTAAKIISETLRGLHSRKVAAGSSISLKDGFITSNMWDGFKFAKLSDDEFYALVKDLDWGDKGTRQDWIDFKNKVQSGNHVDIEDELQAGKLQNVEIAGMMANSSLAEFSGLSRQINLTTEQYIALAPKLFKGDNLIETIGYQIRKDARTVSQLEYFGSDPRKQYRDIVKQIIRRTQNDKQLHNSKGSHILTDDFHYGLNGENSILEKNLFGDVNRADSYLLSSIGDLSRDFNALSSLSGAGITAQMDLVTRAARISMLLNKEKPGGMFADIAKGYRDIARQIGTPEADVRLKATSAGINTLFDEFDALRRFDNPDEVAAIGKGVKRTRQFINKAFKLNGLEFITNANLRASYASAQNIFHSLKDVPLNKLNDEVRISFRNAGLTDAEWDFIRTKAIATNKHGDGLLAVDKLNDLDLQEYKALFPDAKTTASLEKEKIQLASKWNMILFRESKTMTLMPDVIDKARLVGGTRRGTPLGEATRFATQFRSFAYGYTARILLPMLTRTRATTQMEFAAALLSMGMLVQSLKDLVSGKSPRDFTKPENAMGLVGLVAGVPFIDQVGFTLSSDNPQSSNIYEIATGPIFGDLAETTARVVGIGQDIAAGKDPELGKQFARTVLPKLPTKNYPLIAIPHNIMYNELMEFLSPGYKSKRREDYESRGQTDLTGTL